MRMIVTILSLLSTAYSVPLYTVTIRLSPPRRDARIYLSNVNTKVADKYPCLLKINEFYNKPLVCKVPAGKYKLEIDSRFGSFVPPVNKIYLIKKDQTIQSNVKITENHRLFSDEAINAFDKIIEESLGKRDLQCLAAFSSITEVRCARAIRSASTVKGFFDLTAEFKRTDAWKKAIETYTTHFKIAGESYSVLISETGDSGSLITMIKD